MGLSPINKGFLKLGSLNASPSRLDRAWDKQTPGPMHSLQLSAHTRPNTLGRLPGKVNTLSQLVTERIRHQEMNGPLLSSLPPPSALSCPGLGRGSFSQDWGGRGLTVVVDYFNGPPSLFPSSASPLFLFSLSLLLCSVPVLIIHSYLPYCPQVSLLPHLSNPQSGI